MVKITLYGGVGEVGGNKILVEHQNKRLMLDFGTRMGFASEFFSEFLDVRSNTKLKDKLMIGVLPMIPGIYREDLVKPSGLEELSNDTYNRILSHNSDLIKVQGLVTYEEYLKDNNENFLEGILISHAHLDHTGDIGFIHPNIPLYCTNITKTLIDAIDEVTTFKSQAICSKDSTVGFTQRGATPNSPRIEHKNELVRSSYTMKNGEQQYLGPFNVTLIEVDHSIPGAASYAVKCEDGNKTCKILYTGDIRFHGRMGTTIDDYANAVGADIDIMIVEGTRIESESKLTEDEVCEKITQEIRKNTGLVFVDFSWKDTTRYETIYKATEASERTFVINARLAFILNKLGLTPLPDSVKVFLKRKGSCFYSPSDYSRYKHEYGYSVDKDDWVQEASHYENGISAEEIKAKQNEYVLMLSYYDLGQVFDLANQNGKIPGSRFIRAQCEPFCDEMELDEERFINWLDTFGIEYELGEAPVPDGCENQECAKIKKRIARSHVSGHISRPEIKELIEKIGPKIIIPVHTEKPEVFREIVSEIEKNIEIILPELGRTYAF